MRHTFTQKTFRIGGRMAIAGVALLAVAACSADGEINKQTVGAGLGALGGAAIGQSIGSGGGRVAATVVGGLLGALAGSEIGRVMDENDRLRAAQSRQQALERLPSGQAAEWSNPDTGYSGAVTPKPAFRSADGSFCREYEETLRIDGRDETARGVACRQPDGTWRVQS